MQLSGPGLYILAISSLFVLITSGHIETENVSDVHELCRFNRRIDDRYMEDNKSYRLNINSSAKSNGMDKLMLQKAKRKCTLTFKACSSCHLSIHIQKMVIPSCSGDCGCNHFEIQEPLSDFVSRKYCGEHYNDIMYFESKTKVVHFDFVQSVHKEFYVSLTFNVSSNVYIFTEDVISYSKFIETPHFPAPYPPDYSAEFHFKAMHQNSCVQLLFTDFQLSRWSYIEVSGHNGTRTEMFYGDIFRPPVIQSEGSGLNLRFVGNDQSPSSRGFRAMYTFVKMINGVPPEKPHTDCGGYMEGPSGLLELKSLFHKEAMFDCIWIIPPTMFILETHFLSASVLEFDDIEYGYSLEFREGLTSQSNLKGIHRCASSSCSTDAVKDEVIAQAKLGLFIRFWGRLKPSSSILIIYHRFNMNNCTSDEFSCGDGRCLSILLVCDSFSHCIDGSDEKNCTGKTSSAVRSSTAAYVPRFPADFPAGVKPPKMKRVSTEGTSGFLAITVIGSCGILTVVVLISITVYNQYKRRHEDNSRRHVEENIAVVTYSHAPQGERRRVQSYYPSSRDHPPSYEHVVTYNERYPPLFYTRPNRTSEVSSQTPDTAPKFDDSHKNLLCSSDPDASFNEIRCTSNDSLRISLDCSSTLDQVQSLDVTLVTKRLRRTLSLDFADPVENNCNCASSLVESRFHFCRKKKFSRSTPCQHYLLLPDTVSAVGGSCQRCRYKRRKSFVASLRSNIRLSVDDFQALPRQKTYSF